MNLSLDDGQAERYTKICTIKERSVFLLKSTNSILIETIVSRTLKDIQDSPKRSIRNLVDMALYFVEGRFQQHFFQVLQQMLQNEQSAYYGWIRDVVAHVDHERLITFGMNIGYNSCTVGAKHIREIEATEGFNIPWSMQLHIDGCMFEDHVDKYQHLIQQGKAMGIYTWLLFVQRQPQAVFPLLSNHPDCAFILFCPPGEICPALLQKADSFHHAMFAIRFEDGAAEACRLLREKKFLYSIYIPYGGQDKQNILSGQWIRAAEAKRSVFTVFVPEFHCPMQVQREVYAYITQRREQQKYQTVMWEMVHDGLFVDSIISDDACSLSVDEKGNVHTMLISEAQRPFNLFTGDLSETLRALFPKQAVSRRGLV